MVFAQQNTSPTRREIPGIVTGTGASQTAVIKVPFNATYSWLEVRCTIAGAAPTRVQMEAMLGEVRVNLSGRNVQTLSAKQMIAIEEFYNSGIIADTGVLLFNMERLWMLGFSAQNEPEWGTLAETSFEIQIDQVAASTIDLIRVYAKYESTASEIGAYIQRVRVSPPVTAIGHRFISDLPRFEDGFLYALHIECSVAANLTDVRFTADNVELLNLPVLMLNRDYLRSTPRRTIQNTTRTASDGTTSGFVHIDFASRNYDSDAPTIHNIIMEIGRKEPSKLKSK